MMRRERSPDYYVLDALANDLENLETILAMLNSDTELGWTKEWGRAFTRDDIVASVTRAVKSDLVEVLGFASDGKSLVELGRGALPLGDYGDVYVALTEKGRLVHSAWDPQCE